MNTTFDTLPRAIKYAITAHSSTHHLYDDAPYSVHLAMTAHYGDIFSYLLPEKDRDDVLSALWLHDTIEDCRITYNDLKAVFGEKIAEMVYAVTNNRGRTRAERADEDYYNGIRATQYASFIKMCDRMANAKYSQVYNESKMVDVYRREMPEFLKKVCPSDMGDVYRPMIEALKEMTR
ncbi:MAG: HD domain-containing protein [Flavobacteriales bacterium]|nr:HD domain-containing protein [Flavobacteriales bacterium]